MLASRLNVIQEKGGEVFDDVFFSRICVFVYPLNACVCVCLCVHLWKSIYFGVFTLWNGCASMFALLYGAEIIWFEKYKGQRNRLVYSKTMWSYANVVFFWNVYYEHQVNGKRTHKKQTHCNDDNKARRWKTREIEMNSKKMGIQNKK